TQCWRIVHARNGPLRKTTVYTESARFRHLVREFLMTAHKHAAVTCRDVLDRIERETPRITNRSDMLAFIICAHSQRTVFYNFEMVRRGHGHDRIHIAWDAKKMDQTDCFSARSNLLFQLCGIDVTGRRLAVDKYGTCPNDLYRM